MDSCTRTMCRSISDASTLRRISPGYAMSVGGAMSGAPAAGVGPGLACAASTTTKFKLKIKPYFMGPSVGLGIEGVKRNTRLSARQAQSARAYSGRGLLALGQG